MLAKFFSIGDRKYLNNAVVIADVLTFINDTFGDVKNFKIQFRKPFLSQGEFKLGLEKIDGNIIGYFDHNNVRFYFAYTPTDIELENMPASGSDVEKKVTPFNVCYFITDTCRGYIERGFEKVYGPMSSEDKVIFVVFEIPDTSVFNSIIKNEIMPTMTVTEAEHLGDRRFTISVFVDGQLLGYRSSTVKKFNV